MRDSHLHFDSNMGAQKPESIINRNQACPFCDRGGLTDILEEQGSIIWLKNKYPTIQNSFQTVIIESDECESELSLYPKKHLYSLLSFALRNWMEVDESGEYASVLLFKNHGPQSGGSLRHPHMQIVGLKNVDYKENVKKEDFEGIEIAARGNTIFNISQKPRMGFFEFNIIAESPADIEALGDFIQTAAFYVLNGFHSACQSYNLFFYHIDQKIYAKVMPRFPTSPYFVGYSIPQVSNRIDEVANEVRSLLKG